LRRVSLLSGKARNPLTLAANRCVASSATPSQYLNTAQSVARLLLALHPHANLVSSSSSSYEV